MGHLVWRSGLLYALLSLMLLGSCMAMRSDMAQDIDVEASLYDASSHGQVDVVRRLLEGGANVDAKEEDGSTPLHIAAEMGHLEVLAYLEAQGGGNIEAANNAGETPLQLAIQHWPRERLSPE